MRLRAVTLRVGRIYRPSPQMELFENGYAAGVPLQMAIDQVRRMFGETAVMRGYCLGSRNL